MEKLNDFFEKAHLVLVFLSLSLFSAGITYGMLNLFGNFGESQIPASRVFTGSLALGAIMGAGFTGMIYLMRKAQQFYRDCNTLEDKVKTAKSRVELGDLYFQDFTELRKRAFHDRMYSRLGEIHTRMQTVVGFLPKTTTTE